MKHRKTSCECSAMAGPLSLRWRCPACGRTATIKVSALTASCDGDMIRVELRPSCEISDPAQPAASDLFRFSCFRPAIALA